MNQFLFFAGILKISSNEKRKKGKKKDDIRDDSEAGTLEKRGDPSFLPSFQAFHPFVTEEGRGRARPKARTKIGGEIRERIRAGLENT